MNTHLMPTLIAQANGADLSTGFMLMIVGMAIVFVALILILMLLVAMGNLLKESQAAKPPVQTGTVAPQQEQAAPAPPAAAPYADDYDEDIHPEILAVITAAVVAAVRGPFRIQRVRMVSRGASPFWAERGRTAIHTSHRLRKGLR